MTMIVFNTPKHLSVPSSSIDNIQFTNAAIENTLHTS